MPFKIFVKIEIFQGGNLCDVLYGDKNAKAWNKLSMRLGYW